MRPLNTSFSPSNFPFFKLTFERHEHTKWGRAQPSKMVLEEQHPNKRRIVELLLEQVLSKPREKIRHTRLGPNFAELKLSKDIAEL